MLLLTILYIALPNRRRARRGRPGRPQALSTVTGRLLEQKSHSDQIRAREIHERRLRIIELEEDLIRKQVCTCVYTSFLSTQL